LPDRNEDGAQHADPWREATVANVEDAPRRVAIVRKPHRDKGQASCKAGGQRHVYQGSIDAGLLGSTNEVANDRRDDGADQQRYPLGQGKWSDDVGQCVHVDVRVKGSSLRLIFLATVLIRVECP
jgi:hypothetical protein